MHSTEYQNDRFIRAKDIRNRFGISDPTLFRWTNSGKLPKPKYLNSQRVWLESELIEAEERMLASDQRVGTRLS